MPPRNRARGSRGHNTNGSNNYAGGGGGGDGGNGRNRSNNSNWNNSNRHQNRRDHNNSNNGNNDNYQRHQHSNDNWNGNNNNADRRKNYKQRLPWDTFIIDILREENFDPAKLRFLITVVAMLLDTYICHRGEGVTGQELARELGLPMKATAKLFELCSKLVDGALGPDADGDTPMLDADGGISGPYINGSVTEPEKAIWDFITSRHFRSR